MNEMKKPKISLLLPTRNRKDKVLRLFQSIEDTAAQLDNIEVILYIDEDDKSSQTIDSTRLNIKKIIGQQGTMGRANSKCLEASRGDIIILVNDDIVIQTKGWDKKLIDFVNNMSDEIYLAYPNDLFKKAKVATFPIISQKACEILQQPYPLTYKGSFIDTHLMDIFKRLQHKGYNKIYYLNDIVFEHMHYRLKKSKFDDTYKKRDRGGDDATFLELGKLRRYEASRLIDYLKHSTIDTQTKVYADKLMDEKPHKNFVRYFTACCTCFLLDKTLPFFWRAKMFVYFMARYVAFRLIFLK